MSTFVAKDNLAPQEIDGNEVIYSRHGIKVGCQTISLDVMRDMVKKCESCDYVQFVEGGRYVWGPNPWEQIMITEEDRTGYIQFLYSNTSGDSWKAMTPRFRAKDYKSLKHALEEKNFYGDHSTKSWTSEKVKPYNAD